MSSIPNSAIPHAKASDGEKQNEGKKSRTASIKKGASKLKDKAKLENRIKCRREIKGPYEAARDTAKERLDTAKSDALIALAKQAFAESDNPHAAKVRVEDPDIEPVRRALRHARQDAHERRLAIQTHRLVARQARMTRQRQPELVGRVVQIADMPAEALRRHADDEQPTAQGGTVGERAHRQASLPRTMLSPLCAGSPSKGSRETSTRTSRSGRSG